MAMMRPLTSFRSVDAESLLLNAVSSDGTWSIPNTQLNAERSDGTILSASRSDGTMVRTFRDLLDSIAAEHERLLSDAVAKAEANMVASTCCSQCQCMEVLSQNEVQPECSMVPFVERLSSIIEQTPAVDQVSIAKKLSVEKIQQVAYKTDPKTCSEEVGQASPKWPLVRLAVRRGELQLPQEVCRGKKKVLPSTSQKAKASKTICVTPCGSSKVVRTGSEPFRLWPEWTAAPACNGRMSILDDNGMEQHGELEDEDQSNKSSEHMKALASINRCVINPTSKGRIAWELLGVTLLCWDMVLIPMQSFSMPHSDLLSAVDWIIAGYWSTDIPLTFFTGYWTSKGYRVMSRRQIACRYLKSWFVVDVLIISIDWIAFLSLVMGNSGASWVSSLGIVRLGKILRSLRVIRFLRLLRMNRLAKFSAMLQDNVGAEWVSVLIGMVKSVLMIITINHFLACLWYLLGSTHFPGYTSWVEFYHLAESEWSFQYWTSLHWSLTQFSPGGTKIGPQNTAELVFSVVTLLFAMIVFSSFVSSVTNAMARLFKSGGADSSEMWALRSFCKQQHLSRDLAVRVNRYIDVVLASRRNRIQEKDVQLLKWLSAPLLDLVHYEMHIRHLTVHPFFSALNARMPSLVRKLVRAVCRQSLLSRGDVLYEEGETCNDMYFIIHGLLRYSSKTKLSVCTISSNLIHEGSWCCEMILWSPWQHRGRCKAVRDSELLVVDAASFRAKVTKEYGDTAFLKIYGGAYVKALNDHAADHNEDDLTDIQEDLVRSPTMASALRQASGEGVSPDSSTFQASPTSAMSPSFAAAVGQLAAMTQRATGVGLPSAICSRLERDRKITTSFGIEHQPSTSRAPAEGHVSSV